MKTLILILSMSLLSGCAPQFRDSQYHYLSSLKVSVDSNKTTCSTLSSQDINTQFIFPVKVLMEESSHLDHTQSITDIYSIILKQTVSFQSFYTDNKHPSQMYCSAKLDNLSESIESLLNVYAKLGNLS